jgi:hypothetical protein
MTDMLPSSLRYVLSELLTPNHPTFIELFVQPAMLGRLNVPTLIQFLSRLFQNLSAEQLGLVPPGQM